MRPTTIARSLAIGRIGIGALLVLAPGKVLAPWIGPRHAASPGPQVVGTALGIRDLGLGAGTLVALARGDSVKTWMRASVAADLVDLGATLRAREHLPALGVAGVSAMAVSAAALGGWLQATLD